MKNLDQQMSGNVRKRTFWRVRPAKIQICIYIRAGWSESSQGAFWIAKDATFLHAGYEDWSVCVDVKINLSLHWAHMV